MDYTVLDEMKHDIDFLAECDNELDDIELEMSDEDCDYEELIERLENLYPSDVNCEIIELHSIQSMIVYLEERRDTMIDQLREIED